MKISEYLKINVFDLTKGLIVASLTAIIVLISDTISAGTWTFNWTNIWQTGVAAAVAYLMKQLVTNNQGELLQKDK